MKGDSIMKKKIDYIIKKEEKKYYPIIQNYIKSSRLYIDNEIDINRLNEELSIIHKAMLSKTIHYLYCISKELKKNNEPYIINGTLSNLYLLYILGITKFNPIEIGCCFEVCIGTIDNPKCYLPIDIVIRKTYENKLDIESIISSIDEDCYYINHPTKSHQILVIPKEIDYNRLFKTQIIGNNTQVAIDDEYTYNRLLSISVAESDKLWSISHFYSKYGEVPINEAIDIYKTVFFDKALQEKKFIDTYSSFKVNSVSDMLKLMAFYHSTHKVNKPSSYVFSDRESVFEYFNKELGLSNNQSYRLMEVVRKGQYKSSIINDDITSKLSNNILNDLENILYLFPRGHNAEHLYYDAINAYYYSKYKEEYLEVNDIEYDDGEYLPLE